MAKIVDPDNLNQGTEVRFDTASAPAKYYVSLSIAGNLSTDGVSLQALYSFMKEEWRTDSNLIKFPFPMIAITSEQFELIDDWNFHSQSARDLIRDAGWAVRSSSGLVQEEWMNITTLGNFDDAGADLAYYIQSSSANTVPLDSTYTGPLNQGVWIYATSASQLGPDAAPANFNSRSYFEIFLREQGKTFGSYNLLSEQNLSVLTYRKYALPLANTGDVKVTNNDATIASTTPYTGMYIRYYNTPQSRTIGGASYDFSIIIDGNNGTAEQIYEFVQYKLRQTTSINTNSGSTGAIRGDIADELLVFIGDSLYTQYTTWDGGSGVYIDNFQATDTNRIFFTDDTNVQRNFPFVAAGNLLFNSNLTDDANARYWLFFTSVPTGSYGTQNALIISSSTGLLTGSVGGNPTIAFDFDYENNVQGGRTADTDAAYTAVAIGLSTGQYVSTTGTIAKTTTNTVNFVAALERNYSNP